MTGYVEQLPRLDIRQLAREQRLRRSATELSAATGIIATLSDGREIHLELERRQRGQFGGMRHYFRCPQCSGRCEILYVTPRRAACRKCLRLRHLSQRCSGTSRSTQRVVVLLRKLGGTGQSTNDPIPPKPKRMHWTTYNRKVARLEAATERHEDLADARLLWFVRKLQARC